VLAAKAKGLSEIADKVGLGVGTVHRILSA
jgi:DNA-binding IclR family transcriptional regulator